MPPTARLVDATGDVATDSYGALITYSTIIETRPGETSESRIRYSVPAGEEGACADPELLRQPGLRLR